MKKLVNGQLVDLTQAEIDARNAEQLSETTQAVTAHIKAYRKQREGGGFAFGGLTIATDEKTERRIMGAYVQATANASYNIAEWGTDDGFIALSNAQIIAIGDAFNYHLTKCFAAQATVETAHAVTPYTTITEIETAFDNAYNS